MGESRLAEAPRSYMAVTEKGLLRKNRRQLIKVQANKTNEINKGEVMKQGILRTRLAQQEGRTSSLTEVMPFLRFPAKECERSLVSSNANTGTGEKGSSDQVVN
ncbi:hypothetical protein PR048_008505 [Dryococelus australis]|uniref:Uncharacterized protein n=1 Tax=Dryococelus australis TaxID=614101 RepID=A0ABQ9HY35_9NEOP|nr:hypothetical protein PR048_008505 [Dryococelus australis]